MGRKLQLAIDETEQELKELLAQQREGRLKERVQALYWLKSQQVEQLRAVAKLLGRDTATLYRWCERYRDGGLQRLLELDYHQAGRPGALPAAVSQALRVRLQDPQGFASYGAVQRWLAHEYGLELKYKTVHRIVRYRLKAKLKVARSRSLEQAADAVATFKKKLPLRLSTLQALYGVAADLPLRYWCVDESRVGLKTVVRRRLTLYGTKPMGPLQWRFEAFYLYGAVEPATGENFFLEFSHLDSPCFQRFLECLAQHYPNQLHLLQLDNASAHTAKSLQLPQNIILFFQPPHTPEVNPIERLWQPLKDQLSWVSFAHLEALREVISERLRELTPTVVASLTGYSFILGALKHANII